MIRATRMTCLLATAALGLAYAGPAYAQATRTWVSGTGDDVNPCSRTAPCKTFPGAFSKTAAGGEINCIDTGGFGSITITRAVTIKCGNTLGGVLNSGTIGISINAGPNDVIILDGLDINGVGTTPGTKGISFLAGGSLIVRNCLIYGNLTTPAIGVSFTPSGASKLYIERSTVVNNGNSSGGGGILVMPGAGGSAVVEMKDVQVLNNGGYGIRVDGTSGTPAISGNLDNVQSSGNTLVGINATGSGSNTISLMIANSTSSNNGTGGIVASGLGVQVRVGNTTITGNKTGVNPANSSIISSHGDNRLNGNTTDGAFTGTISKQ